MAALNPLFLAIHDYLLVYLPEERKSSPNTIRAYRKSIELLLDFVKEATGLPLQKISFETIDRNMLSQFLQYLENDRSCSVSTRNQRLNCIRSFYKYAAQEDIALVTHLEEIKKIRPAKVAKTIVDHMSENAVNAILQQPDTNTLLGKRDAFMMLFLYKTGARVQELVDIRLCDLKVGATSSVTLHGKGAKARIVPLRDIEVQHLKEYIALFHPDTDLYSQDYLFYTIRNQQQKRMTEDNVRSMVRKYGKQAREFCSEVPENVHPHLFRHSLAMLLYQNGMDLTLISQWLGHSNLETTLIYAHADTELKRRAMEKAIPENSPLKKHLNPKRYKVSDEEMLKRLVGLH